MTDYETAIFRDLTKFLGIVSIGIIIGFAILLAYHPLNSEIRFNIDGAESGFNIITDRAGGCFYGEGFTKGINSTEIWKVSSTCSSGAWTLIGLPHLLIALGIGCPLGLLIGRSKKLQPLFFRLFERLGL